MKQNLKSFAIEDLDGAWSIPACVNVHVHVESSHLIPSVFGNELFRHGTMRAVCDPHEIVNVLGEEGLRFMLEDGKRSQAELFFELPSCVPATPFETAGACLSAEDTERLFVQYPELLALGEMMNVPGVLQKDPQVIGKLEAARRHGKKVEGHFPLGTGEPLRQYAAAGISSDHESSTAAEGLEKLAAGMQIFIREGSSCRNLEALLPIVTPENVGSFCFCTDDRSAEDLRRDGDVLQIVRKAVDMGMPPAMAIQIASANAARYFGWEDTGGRLIVDNLKDFHILKYLRGGKEVFPCMGSGKTPAFQNSMHLSRETVWHLPAPRTGDPVIGVLPTEILTLAKVYHGQAVAHLVVLERHGKNGNFAHAFCEGTGIREGAIASTVAHDSHNLLILGTNEADMHIAAEALQASAGGACVVCNGKILAVFPMPVAGLMNPGSMDEVVALNQAFTCAARAVGCSLPAPLTTISFLALPVIPDLKLTDRGLFDVRTFSFV